MLIAVLAHHGCVASGVSGFSDVFAVANHLLGEQRFDVRILSAEGGAVRPFSGPDLAVHGRLADVVTPDAVYVPPSFGVSGPEASEAAWLQKCHDAGAVACAACAGVFFLAQAGLLDGRDATTHWGLVEDFRIRFPNVRLEAERMLVDGGDYVCAGGLTAYFDLALHLVARFESSELAASCARTLLLDPGRVRQTPYMRLVGNPNHGDEPIARVERWLADNYATHVEVADLAELAHLGERTFLRRFSKATGRTPKGYLQALRVEHAKRRLETGAESVEEIVQYVGYRDGPAFYRLFRKMTGLTPGEYRRRFAIAG